jgi:hypothetical protein
VAGNGGPVVPPAAVFFVLLGDRSFALVGTWLESGARVAGQRHQRGRAPVAEADQRGVELGHRRVLDTADQGLQFHSVKSGGREEILK